MTDLLSQQSLPRAWSRHFEAAGERAAVGSAGEWLTYAELERRSRRPRHLGIVAELPRNALGKVLKHELSRPGDG